MAVLHYYPLRQTYPVAGRKLRDANKIVKAALRLKSHSAKPRPARELFGSRMSFRRKRLKRPPLSQLTEHGYDQVTRRSLMPDC
jgi:hypothetical protein